MAFVGIDVSKLTLDVAVLWGTGEVEHRRLDNSPDGHVELVSWLAMLPGCRIVMESTGSYHRRLARELYAADLHLSVVNPAQAHYFVKSLQRRNKTDKVDAVMLALYARERLPTASPVADVALQSLAREIGALQRDISRLKNRLEAARHGLVHPEVIASLQRRIEALEEEKRLLDRRLEDETKTSKQAEFALLTSIPGVGSKSACYFLAEIGDINRFSTASKLIAYAGLNPMQHQSGSSIDKRTGISRLGSSQLRHIVYMPGLVGIKHNPTLKAFYERLTANGKSKKAALVACSAKLLRIMYGVLKRQQPFTPTPTTG